MSRRPAEESSELTAGAWCAVAWGDEGDAAGGTSLWIGLHVAIPRQGLSVVEARSFARWAEEAVKRRYDHRSIDPDTPDLDDLARRVAGELGPEVARLNLILLAVSIHENPLWRVRVAVSG